MKIRETLSTIALLLLVNLSLSAQNWAAERSILAYAYAEKSPAKITLKWEASATATNYRVYRRDLGSSDWGSPKSTSGPNDSMYEDTDVEINKLYEYKIEKTSSMTEPFSSTNAKMISYSFLISGIELEPVHYRGNFLVLSTKLIYDSLQTEVDLLLQDLRADGWRVMHSVVDGGMDVSDVKSVIDGIDDLNTVFLLGQVPYPYSGNYCYNLDYESPPDGHKEGAGDHCGAWIADLYYGVKDGNWRDIDSVTNAARNENDNYPNDGKFDNRKIPGTVSIEIGRVDLSRLDSFSLTEVQLTKRYLNKLHNYKHNMSVFKRQAIVEDNFASYPEGFSSGALRDFSAHLGPDNIIKADLFNSTASNDYLLSYVCGAGSFVQCNGLGKQDKFVTNNPAYFNHMFGSFFGDFDIKNNISRASLASQKGGLTTIWSGRPKWITHGLAMGEPIGKSAVRSQNNDWDYDVSFYQNYSHIALLGDPSLRTEMISPPTALNSNLNGAKNNVILNWTASNSSDITGYYVYWTNDLDSNYKLLNQVPITGTSMTHYTPTFGTNYYMVRAERLETTMSGSYYNLSLGAMVEVNDVQRTAGVYRPIDVSFSVYPTPTEDLLKVRTVSNEMIDLEIYDALGNLVIGNIKVNNGSSIDVSELTSGIYFLVNENSRVKFIKI